MHATCPAYLILLWFDRLNNVWWVWIMKLLTAFFPILVLVLCLGSAAALQTVWQAVFVKFKSQCVQYACTRSCKASDTPRSEARATTNCVTWSLMSSLIQIKFEDQHPDVHKHAILRASQKVFLLPEATNYECIQCEPYKYGGTVWMPAWILILSASSQNHSVTAGPHWSNLASSHLISCRPNIYKPQVFTAMKYNEIFPADQARL
jgi:hypothetical protein